MVVTPDSTIRLLKCPIKLDDHNQITFNSVANQTAYFQSLPYLQDTNLTYIRKDGVIRCGTDGNVDFEDVLAYNYVMYKNTHYDSKWFYAYITDVRYVNDGCTEISIETDVYQTWSFDATFQTSFIEREHVDNDTVGLHTVPENLEHGEYITIGMDHDNIGDPIYMMAATTRYDGTGSVLQTTVNGIPYQGYIYAFTTPANLATVIATYQGSYIDNIYAVWMAPRFAIEGDVPNGQWNGDSQPNLLQLGVTKPTTINGYTPVNNKVLCYPYRYLLVSNNCGQSNVLKYEGWSGTNCTFNEYFSATVGGDTKIVPTSYYGISSHENTVIGGKFPTLSWSKDLFTNWMSQNAVNIGIGQATSVASIVGGIALIATGGGATIGAGMVVGGIGGIANSLATQYEHSLSPTSAKGNTNASGLNITASNDGFYFYHMSIKSEYARIIDNFFEVYGYKVNRMGTPHIHARRYWDYCKTIDIHITGNIPEKDMAKLRDLFNKGCTFWHDTSHFMDYTQTNSIL